MKEELITLETAVLARKKGFKEPQLYFYVGGKLSWKTDNSRCNNSHKYETAAPSQSLLQRWLREEHKIQIQITPVWENDVMKWRESDGFGHKTYEEALGESLQQSLKLIPDDNNQRNS